MKRIFIVIALAIMSVSCVKEGHVCYRFEIVNATEKDMTVRLSQWGNYAMYINLVYDSEYSFHEVETIKAHSSLIFSTDVGDNPDPRSIPPSITPAWEYIKAIECNGVAIDKEYFTDIKNWELAAVSQINGKFTMITLVVTPELLERLNND